MIKKLSISRLLLVLLAIIVVIPTCYAKSFFEQRYRGWLWFEEKEQAQELQQQQEERIRLNKEKHAYTKARQEVEQFARELEELKYMMIRYPDNLEHVRKYKEKESKMFDNAIKLAATSRMVNFLNPESLNLIDNPINLYGRRIKEELEQQDTQVKISKLAKEVELFFFFSSSCPYCQSLEPVLAEFASNYGFKVEAVSLDGSSSQSFKTHQDLEHQLVAKLNLTRTPTIVLVTNDSSMRFELIRGAASKSELEEASLLAIEYLSTKRQADAVK